VNIDGFGVAHVLTNSSAGAAFTVSLTPPPDLQVTAINAPSELFSGETFNLGYTVIDNGAALPLVNTPGQVWQDAVYLSTTPTLIGANNPVLLAGSIATVSTLASGATYTNHLSLTLPKYIQGSYYLLVFTDVHSDIYEGPGESNNILGRPLTVDLTPPADLQTSAVTAPATALGGQALVVSYTVTNVGATTIDASSWTDDVYLSPTPTLGTNPFLLTQSLHQGALAPGESYTQSTGDYIGYQFSGAYYVIVVANASGSLFELNTANDADAASTPTVISANPADLIVGSFTAPAIVQSNQAVTVGWTVQNTGLGSTDASQWTDAVEDETGTVLAVFTHTGTVAASGTYSDSESFTLPSTYSGAHAFHLVTNFDRSVTETDYTNDASSAVGLNIASSAPYLIVSGVTVPATALSGQQNTTTVGWTVNNAGVGVTPYSAWNDDVYLATSPTGFGYYLGTAYHSGQLAANGSYTVAPQTFVVPSGLSGNYYVVVHPGINYSGTMPGAADVSPAVVAISPSPRPDLSISRVSADTAVSAGQKLNVSWTVTNVGSFTAAVPNGWSDVIYLSTSAASIQGPAIYTVIVNQTLAVNGSYTENASVPTPITFSGPYYVFVVTDTGNALDESNPTSNNTAVASAATLFTLPHFSNVVLTSGKIVATTDGVAGHSVSLTYIDTNTGTDALSGSWTDVVYLSAGTGGALTAEVGTVTGSGSLGPGGTTTGTFTGVLPNVLPGSYSFVVVPDAHHLVTNGTNIDGESAATTSVTVTALAVGAPLNGTVASGTGALYEVTTTTDAPFHIALSTSATAVNELYVEYGAVPTRGSGDYAANTPGLADQDVDIADAKPGTYFVLVYANAIAHSPESFTLDAEPLSVGLSGVSPNSIGNAGSTTLQITGSLFERSAVFELVTPGGQVLYSTQQQFQDQQTAYATFDLTGQAPGAYVVQVLQDGDTTGLTGMLTVTAGGGGKITANVYGPAFVRPGIVTDFTLGYYNSGNTDAGAPIIVVNSVGGQQFGGPPHNFPDGSNPFEVFGLGPTMPGILRPGEGGTVTLDFLPDGNQPQFTISVFTTADTDDTIWGNLEPIARPLGLSDAQWSALWTQVQADVGPTVGDLVQALDADATLLPADQRTALEVAAELRIEVQKAQALLGPSLYGTILAPDQRVPISEIQVTATNEQTGALLSATTMTDGSFYFPSLPPGTYDLDVDGALITSGATVTVGSGPAVTSLVLDTGGILTGSVQYIFGVLFPVQNATVTAVSDTDSSVYSVDADPSGRYTLTGLPPDTYSVYAQSDSYARHRFDNVTVSDAQTGSVTDLNFVLVRSVTITGHVTYATQPATDDNVSVYAIVDGTDDDFDMYDAVYKPARPNLRPDRQPAGVCHPGDRGDTGPGVH
jgi:hypothetical protein